MNRVLLAGLALGLICAAASMDGRPRKRRPSPQPHINDWEDEGGAVPVDVDRTAAQTTAAN